jgi:hypothetical protein
MNNCLICTNSVVEISVKPDELYKRYVFIDEYEITKRKHLFFKKNIKIDRGFVWDEYLDNNKRLKNNYIGLPYIIEDGYVYDDNEKMNAYAKENAEIFMQNKNNRFIGSSNFDSWFNRTLGYDKFYYEVVSDEQTGRVKEILVYLKGCVKMLLSNNGDIYSYSKIDSKRANELLKEIARSIAEYPFMIVDKSNLTFTNFKDEED